MTRHIVSTQDAPAAIGPYSQAIVVGEMVYCSGQIALDPGTGELVGVGDVRAQVERAMKNLAAVLRAAGSGLEAVVRCTLYLVDMDDFAVVNDAYAKFFEGAGAPARATVAVAGLPRGASFEVDAIAVVTRRA